MRLSSMSDLSNSEPIEYYFCMFDINDDALKTIEDFFGMFDIHGALKTI